MIFSIKLKSGNKRPVIVTDEDLKKAVGKSKIWIQFFGAEKKIEVDKKYVLFSELKS